MVPDMLGSCSHSVVVQVFISVSSLVLNNHLMLQEGEVTSQVTSGVPVVRFQTPC